MPKTEEIVINASPTVALVAALGEKKLYDLHWQRQGKLDSVFEFMAMKWNFYNGSPIH